MQCLMLVFLSFPIVKQQIKLRAIYHFVNTFFAIRHAYKRFHVQGKNQRIQ